MDYSIKICGEAGQGIQTIGRSLAEVFSRSGYYVFTHQDYESRIRGGHNFYQIRLSDRPISASRKKIDILISLDIEGISLHRNELTERGFVVYDSKELGYTQPEKSSNFFDIPFTDIAVKNGGSKVMSNVVAVGAVLGMLGMEINILLSIIKDTFKKKGEAVINANIKSAMAGYDYAIQNCPRCSFSAAPISNPKLLLNGVEAIGLGSISAGCKFYTAYPMTPSTGILNFMAEKASKYSIIVEQAEDEIAAINMAIGASFAGVRSMTGTSGGGFALMVEGLSLAGMTETPVVIALGQRPGPATGFPTRTEQADLNFALYTAHGEFPRVLFAPGSPEQAIYLTNKAFDLSEKYQVPAIILFDQYLADCEWTYDRIDTSNLRYTDYRLRNNGILNPKEYKRHAFTESGVTPLAIPGVSEAIVVIDSDEHDEEGHIVEDAETRIRMVEKRLLKKFPLIQKEIAPPLFYGEKVPDIVLICWGSTYGVVKECVEHLMDRYRAAMLHFSEIWPFPLTDGFDYLNILRNARVTICIEHNATGQFARLLKTETGYDVINRVNRFDGRPFTIDELCERILEILA